MTPRLYPSIPARHRRLRSRRVAQAQAVVRALAGPVVLLLVLTSASLAGFYWARWVTAPDEKQLQELQDLERDLRLLDNDLESLKTQTDLFMARLREGR